MTLTLTPIQCARAASAYRALLRAQRFTFKGDDLALRAAHLQTRVLFNRFIPSASASNSPFAANATVGGASSEMRLPDLKPDSETALTPERVNEHIEAAFEIATYLRRNVVQGKRTAEGNYALRITEETERGDNDSIKQPKDARVMRGPRESSAGNSEGGVRRRRRRAASPAAASSEAPPTTGCCGGSGP
ncbi:hypothetical protein JCM3766R1_000354 [Sporobolomyces carnicolor]